MDTIYTLKAQPYTDNDVVEDCKIIMQTEPPVGLTLDEQDQLFQNEAQLICDALYSHLPGGCFDRLLGLMLARRATHFRVTLGG